MASAFRSQLLRVGVVLAMPLGCTTAEDDAPSPPRIGTAAAAPHREVIVVRLAPPVLAGAFREEAEAAGMVTVLLERGLSDLDGVAPEIVGAPVSPGLSAALAPGEPWTGAIRVTGTREALAVGLELCDPVGSCVEQRAEATAAAPEEATAELLGWAALQVARPPAPETAAAWGQPVSADPYASLVTGRAAASWYGLLPPVAEARKGDVLRDPFARAVYIDPSVAVAWWVLGRRSAAEDDPGAARSAFTRASLLEPHAPVFRADEAVALGRLDRWDAAEAAWAALTASGDLRFLLAHVDAALRAGRVDRARELLARIPAVYDDAPRVVELRVAVADPTSEQDALLAHWQEVATGDPEPVRRRIARRVAAGRLEEAYGLTDELARRGAEAEAWGLAMSLGVGLERWADAAAAARRLGRADVAARIEARGALAGGGPVPDVLAAATDPEALVVVGRLRLREGDATEALARAEHALEQRRFLPAALALKADALEALGRAAAAADTRATLALVDPAWP